MTCCRGHNLWQIVRNTLTKRDLRQCCTQHCCMYCSTSGAVGVRSWRWQVFTRCAGCCAIYWSCCRGVRCDTTRTSADAGAAQAGPAKLLSKRWIGPAQFLFYVFGCDFLTRCWSWTNQKAENRPFFCCPRDMTELTIQKKCKSDHNLS